jgi:hypothetical protein
MTALAAGSTGMMPLPTGQTGSNGAWSIAVIAFNAPAEEIATIAAATVAGSAFSGVVAAASTSSTTAIITAIVLGFGNDMKKPVQAIGAAGIVSAALSTKTAVLY